MRKQETDLRIVNIPNRGLINKDQVCVLLGNITKRTLDNWRASGAFPVAPVLCRKGVSTMWRAERVMEWLDSLEIAQDAQS